MKNDICPMPINSIYPYAIGVENIKEGLRFRIIWTIVGHKDMVGLFLGKPYLRDNVKTCNSMAADVEWIENYSLGRDVLTLDTYGLASNKEIFNGFCPFCIPIKDTPKDIRQYQDWLRNGGQQIVKDAFNSLGMHLCGIMTKDYIERYGINPEFEADDDDPFAYEDEIMAYDERQKSEEEEEQE